MSILFSYLSSKLLIAVVEVNPSDSMAPCMQVGVASRRHADSNRHGFIPHPLINGRGCMYAQAETRMNVVHSVVHKRNRATAGLGQYTSTRIDDPMLKSQKLLEGHALRPPRLACFA